MSSRFLKQFIFGLAYLLIFAAIVYGLYFIFRPTGSCFDNRQNQGEAGIDCGGPCLDCALKNAQPVTLLQDPSFLIINDQAVGTIFKLKNINSEAAAERLSYQINFYDSAGDLINSLNRETFIYAGQIKTLIEPVVSIEASRLSRIEILVQNPVWQLAEKFLQPTIQSRAIRTEVSFSQVKVSGLVLNNSGALLRSADIGAVFYDSAGGLKAVSKTVIKDLQPFEERAFSIFAKLDGKKIAPSRTEVFVDARR